MHAEFLYNPDGLGVHAHCPSLLRSISSDVLVAWYAYSGDHDYQNASLVICRKSSGTGEWQKSKQLLGPFQYSAGNPVFIQNPATGEITLFFALLKGKYWNDGIVYVSTSTDDGHTWSPPSALTQEPGFMVRHPGYYLDQSSYLLPVYHEETRHSYLMKNWHRENRKVLKEFTSSSLIQPVIVKGEENNMYVFFRPCGEPRVIWRSGSSDGGKSWSDPIKTGLACPLSGISAFFSLGNIFVVHNSDPERRFPLSISLSKDGGVSWSSPVEIDSASHEVSYPDFQIGSDGMVRGVYSYNRRMIKYREFSVEKYLRKHGSY